MAEQEDKPEAPEVAPPPPKHSKSFMTFGIFGGVMLVEGVAIFLCMKFLGSNPDPTQGIEGLQATTQPWEESQELDVGHLRVLNSSGARRVLYSVHVVVRIHHSNFDKMDGFLKGRKNTIEDVMSRVIRGAEAKHLAEPGLETLRRQLRFELNTLLGDETIIEQVLIPEFTPLPTGL